MATYHPSMQVAIRDGEHQQTTVAAGMEYFRGQVPSRRRIMRTRHQSHVSIAAVSTVSSATHYTLREMLPGVIRSPSVTAATPVLSPRRPIRVAHSGNSAPAFRRAGSRSDFVEFYPTLVQAPNRM